MATKYRCIECPHNWDVHKWKYKTEKTVFQGHAATLYISVARCQEAGCGCKAVYRHYNVASPRLKRGNENVSSD